MFASRMTCERAPGLKQGWCSSLTILHSFLKHCCVAWQLSSSFKL